MRKLVTLIVFVSAMSLTLAHRCYVCGRDAEEPFKDRPKSSHHTSKRDTGTQNASKISPKCEAFERNDNIEQFAVECPSGFTSCLTQIDGSDVMRTCADHPLDDCATANDVIYCYCKDELCNSQKAKAIRDKQKQKRKPEVQHVKTPPPTDDEDLEESSGMGEMTYPTEQRKKQLTSSKSSEETQKSNKNYMITLKPTTETVNATTSSPAAAANASSATCSTLITSNSLPATLLMLSLASFLRIN